MKVGLMTSAKIHRAGFRKGTRLIIRPGAVLIVATVILAQPDAGRYFAAVLLAYDMICRFGVRDQHHGDRRHENGESS